MRKRKRRITVYGSVTRYGPRVSQPAQGVKFRASHTELHSGLPLVRRLGGGGRRRKGRQVQNYAGNMYKTPLYIGHRARARIVNTLANTPRVTSLSSSSSADFETVDALMQMRRVVSGMPFVGKIARTPLGKPPVERKRKL